MLFEEETIFTVSKLNREIKQILEKQYANIRMAAVFRKGTHRGHVVGATFLFWCGRGEQRRCFWPFGRPGSLGDAGAGLHVGVF